MKWIGLTGGIASGKSTVAKILKAKGFSVVDADDLAHRVLSPESPIFSKIVETFGSLVLSPDGGIDRRRLGSIVFANPKKLKSLEALTHPEVRRLAETAQENLRKQGKTVAFYDVPLLFEKKMEPFFDEIVVVSCSEDVQRLRLKARNGFPEEQIEQRLKAQMPLSKKAKAADYVIENDGTEAELAKNVEAFLHQAQL